MKGPFRTLLLCGLIGLGIVLPARSAGLVADLSSHLVAITSGFAGVDVLLFGAIEEPGDVIVVVRGPERAQPVHRKSNVAGIWMNTAQVTFQSAPVFYFIAANRPLGEIADASVLRANNFGIDHLQLGFPAARAGGRAAEEWRQALIRNKQRAGLYVREPAGVAVLSQRLFRTSVHLPSNVPPGLYRAETYVLQDGQIVAAQTTPLSISKLGLEADLFAFAHEAPAAYGAIAVLAALMAGWLAHLLFRRS